MQRTFCTQDADLEQVWGSAVGRGINGRFPSPHLAIHTSPLKRKTIMLWAKQNSPVSMERGDIAGHVRGNYV